MKYISRLTALLLAVMLIVTSAGATSVELTQGQLDAMYAAVSGTVEEMAVTGVLGERESFTSEDASAWAADGCALQWYEVNAAGDRTALTGENTATLTIRYTMTEQRFVCVATDSAGSVYDETAVYVVVAQTSDMEEYLTFLYGYEGFFTESGDVDAEAVYGFVNQYWNVEVEDATLAENVVAAWWAEKEESWFDSSLLCSCVVSGAVGSDFVLLHPYAAHDASCGWYGEGSVETVQAQGVNTAMQMDIPYGAFKQEFEAHTTYVSDAETLAVVDAALAQAAEEYGLTDVPVRLEAYDIHFTDAQGETLQPLAGNPVLMSFTVQTAELTDGDTMAESLAVFHIRHNGAGEIYASHIGDLLAVDPEAQTQTITVEGRSFSIYVVTTVGETGGEKKSSLTMNAGDTVVLYSDAEQEGAVSYRWSYDNNTNFEITVDEDDPRYVIVHAIKPSKITLKFHSVDEEGKEKELEKIEITALGTIYVTFDAHGGTGEAYVITTENGKFTFPTLEEAKITAPEGGLLAGWSTEKGGQGTNYIPNLEHQVYQDTTFSAIWFYPGSPEEKWAEATFYIRKDGEIKFEPASYGGGEYTGGCSGKVHTGVSINNNLEYVALNIAEEPSVESIIQVCEVANVAFDPETQEVVWYVVKQKNPIHVDGVIRNKDLYEVVYHPNGGTGDVPGSKQYGLNYAVQVNYNTFPSRTGYVFMGWSEDPAATTPTYVYSSKTPATFAMPDHQVDLYAIWRPSESTKYVVEHYLCDKNGENPKLALTQEMFGTTGETVAAGYLSSFPNYVKDPAHDGTKSRGVVAADGTLVLTLYYKQYATSLTVIKTGMETGESALVQVVVDGKTYMLSLSKDVPSATIISLQFNSVYTVAELDLWTWGYKDGNIDNPSGTVSDDGTIVTITNTSKGGRCLHDESSVINNLGSGHGHSINNH